MNHNTALTCDIFEVDVELEQNNAAPILVWSFYTDLPAGTQVIMSCERSYQNMRGEIRVWSGQNGRIDVQPAVQGDYNGATGRVELMASDKQALGLFNELLASFSSGIKTPVSDELTLRFTVGARQRLRAFGKNNCELSGQMVHDSGGINIVEVRKVVHAPMATEIQPIDPEN